jgi:hypothetical protein
MIRGQVSRGDISDSGRCGDTSGARAPAAYQLANVGEAAARRRCCRSRFRATAGRRSRGGRACSFRPLVRSAAATGPRGSRGSRRRSPPRCPGAGPAERSPRGRSGLCSGALPALPGARGLRLVDSSRRRSRGRQSPVERQAAASQATTLAVPTPRSDLRGRGAGRAAGHAPERVTVRRRPGRACARAWRRCSRAARGRSRRRSGRPRARAPR